LDELRRLREDRRMSQQGLADVAGVSKVAINQIEGGKRSPNVTTLEKLAEALDVEVADLFPKVQAPLPFEAQETAQAERRTPTAAELQEVTANLERLIARRQTATERWRATGIDALEDATCGAYEMDRANEQIYRDLQAWGADEVIKRRDTLPAEHVDAAYERVNAFSRLLGVTAEARNVVWELSKQVSREAAGGLAQLEEIRLEESEA
jgi:transcriptional regulator with XRE-family HTH domain